MKKPLSQLTAFLVSITILLPSLRPLLAADFNPNFIISDEEMQNAKSMNREDIQAFLDNQGGYIATLTTPDYEGTLRSASDIIYRTAMEHLINPKYILVKLQKEQSLITDKDPTQKQLDWATGYGVCDSCSMSDPAIQKYKGFGKQVDYSAGIIRWYYDHVSTEAWIKRSNVEYNIDNTPVVPANLATAFLYTYTPHIHGNKNFWTLWQRWFDQVYPNGTLVKGVTDPTVYLIQEGKKRAITSMGALVSRFDPKLILTVPDTEIARYESGTAISFPNYSILKNGSSYYLLDFDTIRPFATADVVRQLGYNPEEIIEVSSSDIAGMAIGTTITGTSAKPMGQLVRLKETNQLYYLKDNVYYTMTDEVVGRTNFPNAAIGQTDIAALQNFTQGNFLRFKDGTLVGVKGFNKIYVIENGKKRHISSEEVFLSLGYSWANVVWTDEVTASQHETTEPLYLKRAIATETASVLPTPTPIAPSPASPAAPVASPVTFPNTPAAYATDKIFETPVHTYLVADATTGAILSGKNIDYVHPAASLTKVMSAYQMLLEGLSLARVTTYYAREHNVDGRFRVVDGEQLLNEHVLLTMLVSSYNTPARMLVDQVEPNEAAFIARMNTAAKGLGLTNTEFTDPSGLDPANKTTARDYLTLYSRASKNIDLQRILGLEQYEYNELKDIDGKPRHYDYHTNELMEKNGLPFRILTSKTGYLSESGAHLVMHIERNSDKKQFMVMTMGNPDYDNRFAEPERLARWTLNTF